MICPKCKSELEGNPTHCHICGFELFTKDVEWVMIGAIENRMWADSAVEMLKSKGIQAVVISKSGFFGNAGLPLNPIYEPKGASFEISVPIESVSEAEELLEITLGDNWQQREK